MSKTIKCTLITLETHSINSYGLLSCLMQPCKWTIIISIMTISINKQHKKGSFAKLMLHNDSPRNNGGDKSLPQENIAQHNLDFTLHACFLLIHACTLIFLFSLFLSKRIIIYYHLSIVQAQSSLSVTVPCMNYCLHIDT